VSNPPKAKGDRAERDVVASLDARGIEAVTSRNMRGGKPAGEDIIAHDMPVAIEVKDGTGTRTKRKACGCKPVARDRLGSWIDQARRQAAPGRPGAVVHKRRGRADAAEWFVTMQWGDFIELTRRDAREF